MYDSQMHVTISFYAEKEMELLPLIDKMRDKIRDVVLSPEPKESPTDLKIRVGENSKADVYIEFYDDGEDMMDEQSEWDKITA